MPLRRRECEVCLNTFQPPRVAARLAPKRCKQCRDLEGSREASGYEGAKKNLPKLPVAELHRLGPPLRQAIFDTETWGLERGWGVLLVGSVLMYGDGEPKMTTFDLRMSSKWPNIRSDDSELAAVLLELLASADILIGHNARDFDLKYLNSIALKYGMPSLNVRLIDPVQIARRKYRIGSNSLASLADFLGAPERKMPLGPDVWKNAVLDNDTASWELLRERCESDVRVLNFIAGKVAKDAGLIDYSGSAWRG